MMPPRKPGLMRQWIPAFLVLILLLAACQPVQQQSEPEPDSTVTPEPFGAAAPFCEEIAHDPEHAAQVIALLEQLGVPQNALLRSYLLFGEKQAMQGALDLLNNTITTNELMVVEHPFEFDPLYGGASFAHHHLVVISRSDGEPLAEKERQEIHAQIGAVNDIGVVLAPNLMLQGATHHSIGGSPFGNPPLNSSLGYTEVITQYAFTSMQLPDSMPLVQVAQQAGQTTQATIYILDSWPDLATELSGLPLTAPYTTITQRLELGPTSYDMVVSAKPLMHEASSAAATDPTLTGGKMHGRFVAGLAHMVAPNADLHAIRVLNDAGEGHLSDLVQALAEVERLMNATGLGPAVINLSLGLNCLEIAHDTLAGQPAIDMSIELNNLILLHERLMALLDSPRAIVVAAAGNTTFPNTDHYISTLCPPTAATTSEQFPACMKGVISAGASTRDFTSVASTIACYSMGGANHRALFAFAGDGDRTGGNCVDNHTACTHDNPDCAFGLLGLKENPAQYAFWSGTSFAAPQVSGAAAVLLSMRVPVQQVGPCLIDAVRPVRSDTSPALLNLYKALDASTRPSLCLPEPMP